MHLGTVICTSVETLIYAEGTSTTLRARLTSITSVVIPNTVTSIGNNTFSGCYDLCSVNIPSSVSNIKSYAFSDCSSLRSVNIPSSVKNIENNVFMGCSNITSIIIPDDVTSIGDYAFAGCARLEKIYLGISMKSIGMMAFSNCLSLTSLTSNAIVPPICDIQALEDINKYGCKLYVPKKSQETYKIAEQWKDFIYIEDNNEIAASINAFNGYKTSNVIYDLSGRRNTQIENRLFIKNGKKIIK